MIRDSLNISFPDRISTALSLEEEKHLVDQVIKILRLLQDKGVGLEKAGRVYAEAIKLEFDQNDLEKFADINKTPEHFQDCLVCHGTNLRPSQQ